MPEAAQELAEVLAGYVFLNDLVPALHAAHFVDRDDIGVDQLGCRLSLVMKPADIRLVAGEILTQNLDRDLPAKRKLFGQIDFGHAPPPQSPQELIVPQPSPR